MSGAGFLRVKKLKGAGIVLEASKHNLRENQAEYGASGSIDATRIHLNETLAGPVAADDVARLAKDLMKEAGVVTLRKDAVMALELVLSLPVGTTIDDSAFFNDGLRWVQDYFACPVLSAAIHRDEAAPHCHVLLLPLVDGRMVGNKLIGGRPQLLAMQKAFHESVASQYGLRKAPARLAGTGKQDAASMVLDHLRKTGDSALQSAAWSTIRDCIENAPERFLEALGLVFEPKAKPTRTSTQIFTSAGKGPRRERLVKVNPPNLTKLDAPNAIAFEKPRARAADPRPHSNARAFLERQDSELANAIAFPELQSEKVQRLCSVAFAQPLTTAKVSASRSEAVETVVDDDGVVLEVVRCGDGTTRLRERVGSGDDTYEAVPW